MRERLLDAAIAVVLVVLQTSAGGPRGFWGLRLDLLLLFVLTMGLSRGETAGMSAGIILGFVQDTFSAGLPGLNILTKGLLGFASGSLRGQLDCGNPNTQAIVATVATLAEGLAQLVLLQVFSAAPGLLAPLLGSIAPAAAAHGALLPAGIAARGAALRWRGNRRVATAGA
jgi:rod shape-determining protein MreD